MFTAACSSAADSPWFVEMSFLLSSQHTCSSSTDRLYRYWCYFVL